MCPTQQVRSSGFSLNVAILSQVDREILAGFARLVTQVVDATVANGFSVLLLSSVLGLHEGKSPRTQGLCWGGEGSVKWHFSKRILEAARIVSSTANFKQPAPLINRCIRGAV